MTSPDGSAEQARALLQAVTDWVAKAMPAPPSGNPGPECQWCPLCQLASVLRGEHPELTVRLLEAGEAVSTALQVLGRSAGESAAAGPTTPTASGSAPASTQTQTQASAQPATRRRPRPGPGRGEAAGGVTHGAGA